MANKNEPVNGGKNEPINAEENETTQADKQEEAAALAQAALPSMYEDFMEVVGKYEKTVPYPAIAAMLYMIRTQLITYKSMH